MLLVLCYIYYLLDKVHIIKQNKILLIQYFNKKKLAQDKNAFDIAL